jgi:hypothetical protein
VTDHHVVKIYTLGITPSETTSLFADNSTENIVMCRELCMAKTMGSIFDDWVY